jgi:DNA-directed RNA polymerase-3 subunit RPC5
MEIDAKEERGAAVKENDLMDVDKEEDEDDVVLREIDVYYTPSVDPNTQVNFFLFLFGVEFFF